ncbi:hypothetical protein CK501_00220 [Halovibrio salipaludis]|uniref:Uncharacterized protein n=1 Tax=Halovibrio salipaludis TaxID=2032626 RepID=A0A2A2FAJ8_9GAMM|nr:hypothetical protein [Halovibrio salipaludis]PAU81615.1 hypothetical protein CK501_00220 [Halovibrio salipaludis]
MNDASGVARILGQESIVGARKLVAEYCFRLEGILTNIRVWIYEGVNGDWVEADQNYYLQAPGMKEPAVPENARYGSVDEALREIVACFLEGYEQAVQQGYEPDSDWLMPGY